MAVNISLLYVFTFMRIVNYSYMGLPVFWNKKLKVRKNEVCEAHKVSRETMIHEDFWLAKNRENRLRKEIKKDGKKTEYPIRTGLKGSTTPIKIQFKLKFMK